MSTEVIYESLELERDEQNAITQVTFDQSWLQNDQLQLTIVQTCQPDFRDVEEDAPRPHTVKTILDLLGGDGDNPRIHDFANQRKPTLLLLPEYALGSDDFDQIDEAVRSYQDPLILISGFGASLGCDLQEWHERSTNTHRHLISGNLILRDDSRYNGGWCWVHRPEGTTECFLFVKNFLEQSLEVVELPELEAGTELLRLNFNDLVLYPLICADLLESNSQNASSCITENLNRHEPVRSQKVLCTVSAWQLAPHPSERTNALDIWKRNIAQVTNLSSDPLLAIANHGSKKYSINEENDEWRTINGVYIDQRLSNDDTPFPTVRAVTTGGTITGRVIRDTRPCVTGSPLRWTPGATEGRRHWRPKRFSLLTENGSLGSAEYPDALAIELGRLIKVCDRKDSNEDYALSIHISDEAREILRKISDSLLDHDTAPEGSVLIPSLLKGLDEGSPSIVDELNSYENELLRGLQGLAEFRRVRPDADWSTISPVRGQLRVTATGRSVIYDALFWVESHKSASDMRTELRKELTGAPGHPLLVIAKAGVARFKSRPLPRFYDDHTDPDPSSSKDIGGPVRRPSCHCWSLLELEEAVLGQRLEAALADVEVAFDSGEDNDNS